MTKYKVCITVTTSTNNFIEIEADNEDEATMLARDKWYAYGESMFYSKCLSEEVEDITAEEA